MGFSAEDVGDDYIYYNIIIIINYYITKILNEDFQTSHQHVQ